MSVAAASDYHRRVGTSARRRFVFVLPPRAGGEDDIRRLLSGGLDLEDVPGVERYEVFVTAEELILVCEAKDDAALLSWIEAWREHLAGQPRLAESVYSWARPRDEEELSFLPTPGPGDSDGGDIF
jgi:hypothetical protein